MKSRVIVSTKGGLQIAERDFISPVMKHQGNFTQEEIALIQQYALDHINPWIDKVKRGYRDEEVQVNFIALP